MTDLPPRGLLSVCDSTRRDHAETRAKLAAEQLQKFKSASAGDVSTLKQRVAEAEARLAKHGPEAWTALKAQLSDANEKLKRARADVKRLQDGPGGSRGEDLDVRLFSSRNVFSTLPLPPHFCFLFFVVFFLTFSVCFNLSLAKHRTGYYPTLRSPVGRHLAAIELPT